MFPLRFSMTRSGRTSWSMFLLLTEAVPTFAPSGRSSSGQGRITSSSESRGNMATTVSSGSTSMGMSFRELTEQSIWSCFMASSSSRTKAPVAAILSSGDVRSMSPRDLSPTTSQRMSGLSSAILSQKISVCLMASLLSRVPTLIP